MEKQFNIRDLFGLTQIEMAILLQISRARYSMYESGKRSLPLEASHRLAKCWNKTMPSKPTIIKNFRILCGKRPKPS